MEDSFVLVKFSKTRTVSSFIIHQDTSRGKSLKPGIKAFYLYQFASIPFSLLPLPMLLAFPNFVQVYRINQSYSHRFLDDLYAIYLKGSVVVSLGPNPWYFWRSSPAILLPSYWDVFLLDWRSRLLFLNHSLLFSYGCSACTGRPQNLRKAVFLSSRRKSPCFIKSTYWTELFKRFKILLNTLPL